MGELTLLLWLKSNLKEKELVWAYNSHATVHHGVEGLAAGI